MFADVSVMDAPLDVIATATRISLCSAQPTDFANIDTVDLANGVLDGTDFTKAAGDISGRKVTIAQQDALSVHTTGTASHTAYDDGVTLLYVKDLASTRALEASDEVTITASQVEHRDPVAA